MKKLKKVCVCSVAELVRQLQQDMVDIDHSFAVLSLSQDLTAKDAIISTIDHCACNYQDVDFDFYEEGLTKESAKSIAADLVRRTPEVRYWYFVSDEGFRRSAAMCCAFLRYLGCKDEEFDVWQQTEVNVSVYSLMCRSLGVALGGGDLPIRIHTNYEASQSTSSADWIYSRYVHWAKPGNKQGDDTKASVSARDIHDAFQTVKEQLDKIILQLEDFIESEKAMGYGEAEDSDTSPPESLAHEDDEVLSCARRSFEEISPDYKWIQILRYMIDKLGAGMVNAWFDGVKVVHFSWHKLRISVRSQFIKGTIERRCIDLIQEALMALYDCNATVEVVCDE